VKRGITASMFSSFQLRATFAWRRLEIDGRRSHACGGQRPRGRQRRQRSCHERELERTPRHRL
jgi:hypothetical protein